MVVIRTDDMSCRRGGEHFFAELDRRYFLETTFDCFCAPESSAEIIVDVPNDVLRHSRRKWPVQIKTSKICVLAKENRTPWN